MTQTGRAATLWPPPAGEPPRLRPDGWTMLVAWLVSRTVMVLVWANLGSFIVGDVNYYYASLDQPAMAGTLPEYPAPVVWVLSGLRALSGDQNGVFIYLFCLLMGGLDAAVCALLWRRFSRRAAVYWMSFMFAIGPLIWFRLDMIPAVLVALGLLLLSRRPVVSGVLVAAAAATKLWPALLILPLSGRSHASRRRLAGFGAAGGSLGLLSLALVGWQRSISPLTWQSDRGLQIESIAASVPMARHAFSAAADWQVSFSRFNAFEIDGPGVRAWQHAWDYAFAVAVLLVVAMGALVMLRGEVSTATVLLCAASVVSLMIVSNKTYSPQYMMWLAGPVAALLCCRLSAPNRRRRAWLVGLSLLVAALTQLVYPLLYSGLIQNPHNDQTATLVLLLRNVLMTTLAVLTTGWAFRALLAPPERVGLR